MNIQTGKLNDFKPINYINNKYVISWGLEQLDENSYKWKYFIMNKKPTLVDIKNEINSYVNEKTRKAIETQFYWNDMNIKLTLENQIDYKLLFDTTMLQDGSNLPEKLKFKVKNENIYYEIESIEEFKDFIIKMNNHIRYCIQVGYNIKESINYEEYKI